MDDPKLARQLARGTWIVLVASFVLLTRFPLEPTLENAAVAVLLVVFCVLNAPVAIGLQKTWTQRGLPAWRAIAVAFGFRVMALAAVIAVVATN